jgi:putative NAD(P)-binding protein
MTRNPEAALFPPGVEVVRGDVTLPDTLDGCLDDIDAVFLVWTAGPATVAPALERIARKARRIVFLSSPHKTTHPFFQQPNRLRDLHAGIERLIESSGLEWTFRALECLPSTPSRGGLHRFAPARLFAGPLQPCLQPRSTNGMSLPSRFAFYARTDMRERNTF